MSALEKLRPLLGEALCTDALHRMLYATDASVYRERPMGVAWPRNVDDLGHIVSWAAAEGIPLIPRTAGTSLAGQVVGRGLVLDFSRYMTRILEIDPQRRSATVEPGVIRDQLNRALLPYGLQFGPNTSTANRCMIGGMVGNNSCGSSSIVYGSTRDRLLALDTLLSDGSAARFEALDGPAWRAAALRPDLEGRLYARIGSLLSRPEAAAEIRARYPKPAIHRRNTGYALDILLGMAPFTPGGPPFNFCALLAGSEGTLALTHRITLQLDDLPPPHHVLVCAHYRHMRDMTEAVLTAMRHPLYACELMDRTVLECTRASREQRANRFFLEGDPAAVLIMECRGQTPAEAESHAEALIADLKALGSAYAFPVVRPPDSRRVWDLRAAGLGVLANLPGDAKAVACIEDTAVALEDLPDYIDDLDRLIRGYGQRAAYFAHAGAGEIHVRPILDLKKACDQALFHDITASVAELVGRYKGSFSGEHGDGRLRGSFIPPLYGERISGWFGELKATWDPAGIFNPGKITAVPPMLESLRYAPDQPTRHVDTALDFSDAGGILRMAERCNGSGDCRKLPESGGTMCPSYQVTRAEKDSPRGRANVLRECLTHGGEYPFDSPELAEAMDLCLSCKGCTRECPSGVDISLMKAEWQHQVHRQGGIPWRTRLFGELDRWNRLAALAPGLANTLAALPPLRALIGRLAGIHPRRRLPQWNARRFRSWFRRAGRELPPIGKERGQVWLLADEFTEHYDLAVGQAAVRLLQGLGYRVTIPPHRESGRAAISKGMLDRARALARHNIRALAPLVSPERPLIGLEPSALLGFRDEYPRLAGQELREEAEHLRENSFLLEEFLYREAEAGRIGPEDFDGQRRHIVLHGHCHQKALSEQSQAAHILALPAGHRVEILATGCCGMAGSFGYEKGHYDLSMGVGELTLFPALRGLEDKALIAASGHSCRHQIADGTGRRALHVAEILADCLRKCD
jgi:FAD/FMN-containing dehydrogenase/Fe-S oxidoreductase